jgi:Calcineurin-like phosphoesterase
MLRNQTWGSLSQNFSNFAAARVRQHQSMYLQKKRITIVCISDPHNSKPSLPDGDILLHYGDLSQYGTFAEIQAQLDWLNSQPHKHKIVIAGNHNLILDESFVKAHQTKRSTRSVRAAKIFVGVK